MAKDVIIFDTTLRDGEQAPGNAMSPEAKLRLARQLDALGVDVIEAGFPAASQGDLRGVQQVADAVQRPIIAALARCHDGDIDRAAEALTRAARKRIHVFIATSDLHLEQKLRIDRATCVERVRSAVQRARGYACAVSSWLRSPKGPRRSICRIPSATRPPPSTPRCSAPFATACPRRKKWC